MDSFIYRELDVELADQIMNICEANSVEYDIWGDCSLLIDSDSTIELGLIERDWNWVDKALGDDLF